MIPQIELGKRAKVLRTQTGLTQKEVAAKIGVSEQALSKWENGDCLPDLYNLTLLARALHVSTDYLLDTEAEITVETVKIGSAVFEVVEKPAAIFAGKILQAKDFPDMQGFYSAVELLENEGFAACNALSDPALPLEDIHLSVNFWREEKERAFGAVRKVLTNCQPSGVDLYQMPASLYIRAHTDQSTAQLLAKEQCEVWELFAYIRDYLMPSHGYKMAEHGAQELTVFDHAEHRSGWAYVPVTRS